MLSDIRYWEKKATEGHYAIPHFNVWNAEMLTYKQFLAGSVVVAVPITLLFLKMQKYYVEGVTAVSYTHLL